MKKVFALLSVFTLTLLAFGLAMNPSLASAAEEPAEGKFFVDPTLSEDGKDIPLYVMNSIYTTFPNYYDYAGAKGTEYEDLTHEKARYFPWNETKLIIPQFGADGLPTGYRYTVYADGASGQLEKDGSEVVGTGYRIFTYEYVTEKTTDAEGNEVETKRLAFGQNYKGKFTERTNGIPDPSLSRIAYNKAGEDVILSATTKYVIQNDGTPLSHLIFDGQGRLVRGMLTDNYYVQNSPLFEGAETFESLFCYEDGVVVLRGENDDHCDRLVVVQDKLDEEGNPIQAIDPETGLPMEDAEGNPVYEQEEVETEEPKLANDSNANRWMFQWYTQEQFEALGVKVNTAGYMQEGWLADRWDFSYEDNGGVMCIAIIRGMTQYGKLDAAQSAIHNASVDALIAAGQEAPAKIAETVNEETQEVTYAAYTRPCFEEVLLPKDGILWDYGYLNRYSATTLPMYQKVYEMFNQGYKYGRAEAYQATAKAFNFSAKGLQYQTGFTSEQSLIVNEKTAYGDTIEVLAGSKFNPAEIISISGMLGGYKDLNDVLSYTSMSSSELDYLLYANGERVMWPKVEPTDKYTSWDKFTADFLKDMGAHLGVQFESAEKFFDQTYGKEGMLTFWDNPAYAEKWAFLKEEILAAVTPENYGSYGTYTDADGNPIHMNYWRSNLWAYLNKSYRAGWPASSSAWDGMEDPEWIGPDVPQVFYYPTWDEFVADLIKDLNAYLGSSIESAEKFFDNTYNYTGMLDFWSSEEYGEKWAFLYEEITKAVTADNYGPYGDYTVDGVPSNYLYWRSNLWAYLNKSLRAGWPASTTAFNEMADPSWIGVEKVSAVWGEYEFDTTGIEAGSKVDFELTVTNKATGLSRSKNFSLLIVDTLTPHLQVNQSKLTVVPEAGAPTVIDLASLAQAFDGYWVEGVHAEDPAAAKGKDISHLIEWEAPAGIDVNNAPAGKHAFKATITSPKNPDVKVSEWVMVNVVDITAPLVLLEEEVVVPFGSYPTAADIIKVAWDDVDGNLFTSSSVKEWYRIDFAEYDAMADGTPCKVYVTIFDAAGNSVKKSCDVTVGYIPYSLDFADSALDALDEIKEQLEELAEAQEALKADVQGVKAAVDQQASAPEQSSSCGAAPAAYFVSAALAAGCALVLLKKKH